MIVYKTIISFLKVVMLTVSKTLAMISLDSVHKTVRQGCTVTSVTKPVEVVQRDVKETQGCVKGRVLLANLAHIVTKRAIKTVKDNAIKQPGSVSAVLEEGLDVTVEEFALVVQQGVTKTLGNVKGRVLKVNLVHVASNHAARPAKEDVIKHQGSVTTVLKVDMEISVPTSVVQAVCRAVINSMVTVCVKRDGKEMDVKVC